MIYGGKNFVASPPAFSNDAKRLLVCTGNTVSIYSTSTGMLVTELMGHTAPVTSIVVVPSRTKLFCYCWSSSLDGTMRYWDFLAPELVKTVDIKLPIFSMIIPSFCGKQEVNDENMENAFAYVSVQALAAGTDKSTKSHGQIRKLSLKDGQVATGGILTETTRPASLTVSPSGQFFGIRIKRALQLWKVPTKNHDQASIKRIKLHHTKDLSSLAFHPTENIVAAGDVSGRILVWRGFGSRKFVTGGKPLKSDNNGAGVRDNDDADACSTWHWHSNEVKVLSFSSDGAYLYSGGHEGVLVMWQLDTGKKKFLPRIGSPLLHFVDSPDPLYSSICCADNRIHILKMPSLEIIKTVSGIRLPCASADMWNGTSGSFVFDREAGLVGLCTDNYCIQFYSMMSNREVSEVQVCERNHQPADDITVVVSLVSLSLDGCKMTTVETRLPEDGVGGLVCLKFWATQSQKKDFKLATVVYEPHRDAAISDVAFHPGGNMVASASHGGDFRIWVRCCTIEDKDQAPENAGWTCHAVGSYRKKPMTAAAFSSDGSVLAVAAENVITLWDPERNVLVAVIGETSGPIHKLSFVGGSEYLISASGGLKPQLSVWNLSTFSLAWSYRLHVEAVACTDDGSSFAVLSVLPTSSKLSDSDGNPIPSRDGFIALFNVKELTPKAVWSVRKANGGGLAFLRSSASMLELFPSGTQSAFLTYIDSEHQYVVFDPYNKDTTEVQLNCHKGGAELETELYGYTKLYGELSEFKKPKDASEFSIVASERPWETLFSGSTRSLPSLTQLCSTFLESLLEKRTTLAE